MSTDSTRWLQTTTCPECGLPAEVVVRHVMASTDGPVEHARVQCVGHHVFNLPVAMLAARPTVRTPADPARMSSSTPARHQ